MSTITPVNLCIVYCSLIHTFVVCISGKTEAILQGLGLGHILGTEAELQMIQKYPKAKVCYWTAMDIPSVVVKRRQEPSVREIITWVCILLLGNATKSLAGLITSNHRQTGVNVLCLVNRFSTSSVKCWTVNFCLHVSKGPDIIMNQLKFLYNSPFKNSYSHPIHTCFPMIASNERGVQILSFSCSFRQKNCKIIPIWQLAHALGKILDPPLQIDLLVIRDQYHVLIIANIIANNSIPPVSD